MSQPSLSVRPPMERVTGIPMQPPTNTERYANWEARYKYFANESIARPVIKEKVQC